MNRFFKTFDNRLDQNLAGFCADDNAALLADISTNCTTGYVGQRKAGGAVSVPRHAQAAVSAHLIGLGWRVKSMAGLEHE